MNWTLTRYLLFSALTGWNIGGAAASLWYRDYLWTGINTAVAVLSFFITRNVWIEWKATKEGDK
jgi:hypothetical protein